MRVALIADTFPPKKSSGSIQLWDLATRLSDLGHEIWVIVPSSEICRSNFFEQLSGVNILRIKTGEIKETSHIKRAMNEFLMPFLIIWNLKKTKIIKLKWDGIIWYSPSIFFGPVAWYLKKKNKCKAYLILRDMFPQWALDLGLIKRGPAYSILSMIEFFQYWVADVIGVQSNHELFFLRKWNKEDKRRIELLNNWLDYRPNIGCSIEINKTKLAGRTILVYAGNMGVAQNVIRYLDWAQSIEDRRDIGFIFVGRGDQLENLKLYSKSIKLENTLFFDEIQPEEIPGLYSQCTVGLISLDERHKSSNIPGKFISYMQFGLPTLALVNKNNELIDIIKKYKVGLALNTINSLDINDIFKFLDEVTLDNRISDNCLRLYKEQFTCQVAVEKVLLGLS